MRRLMSGILVFVLCLSMLSGSVLAIELPDSDVLESAVTAVENADVPEAEEAEPETIEPDVRDVTLPVRTAEPDGVALFAEAGSAHAPEGEAVSFASVGVSAPVLNAASYTTADLVQLMKYLVGAESSFDASTADINGDGETDILDVIRLLTLCAEDTGLAPEGHTGWFKAEDGSLYYYDENGEMLVNSWLELEGKVYYFGENGAALTGWVSNEDGSIVYYFWPDGSMHTGWLLDGEDLLYFKENGAMAWSEWVVFDGVEHFFAEDGTLAQGPWLVADVPYIFVDGVKQTGWVQFESAWYYGKADGTMAAYEWQKINGEWYFFNGDGTMLADGFWEIEEGKVYCFNENGTMHTGWKKYDGEWFYFSNYMVTGKWKEIDGEWYYFGSNGVMYHDTWFSYNGYRYYFKSNGAMACNETLYLKDPDMPGLERYFTFDSEGHGKGQL